MKMKLVHETTTDQFILQETYRILYIRLFGTFEGAFLREGGLFERGGLFIFWLNYMIIFFQHKAMCVKQLCILTILTQL